MLYGSSMYGALIIQEFPSNAIANALSYTCGCPHYCLQACGLGHHVALGLCAAALSSVDLLRLGGGSEM